MYIAAASTISHQPTFRNAGFSRLLSALDRDSVIQHPDYSAFIPAGYRRRMSDILKMAACCALDCVRQVGDEQPEAIIVGTSMGCTDSTRNFLDKIIAAKGELLSPTSFIFSTHNTIAGQISLLLENYHYNMTHTQNSLSFEQALIDGMLCGREGCARILVGAADETQDALYDMSERLHTSALHSTCGASFFLLSAEIPDHSSIRLVDVKSIGFVHDLAGAVADFLRANELSVPDVDLLLYSASQQTTTDILSGIFDPKVLVDYQDIAGCYFTNSAFAMHYGTDILQQGRHPFSDQKIRRVLICNNTIPENLGLVLLDNDSVSL